MALIIVSCRVFSLIQAKLESDISKISFPVAALYSEMTSGGNSNDTKGSLNCVPKYDRGAIGF